MKNCFCFVVFLISALFSLSSVGISAVYANSNIYVPVANGDLAGNFNSEGTNPTPECLANAFHCVNTNDGTQTVRAAITSASAKETYFYGIVPQNGLIDNVKICSVVRRDAADSSKFVRNIINAPQGQVSGFNHTDYLGFFTGERCDNFPINPLTGQKWGWEELQGKNGFEVESRHYISITYTYIQIDWTPTQTIEIDIKPNSDPNSINIKSFGRIPVAMMGAEGFEPVAEVERGSLTFGRTGDEESLDFCNESGEDVNGDGLLDLVCHFKTGLTDFAPDSTEGILRGKTIDDSLIEGRDSIEIVSKTNLFQTLLGWFGGN